MPLERLQFVNRSVEGRAVAGDRTKNQESDAAAGARLRQARKAAGYQTGQQFCEVHGFKTATLSMHENGRRAMDVPTVKAYADALGNVDPVWIMFGVGRGLSPEAEIAPADISFIRLEIRGAVQAGEWKEAVEWPREDWRMVYVPRPDGHKSYYGLVAEGTSMDQIYPPGTILVCVPIMIYDHALTDRMKVVVERRDASGLIEATVKELRQHEDGSVWLWPRSNDPRFQAPIPMPQPDIEAGTPAAGTDDIRITGVVVQSVREEEPAGEPIRWGNQV